MHHQNTLSPLLLPSPNNIRAFGSHISAAMPRFLKKTTYRHRHQTITCDTEGRARLPADYPYAAEFKQAFDKNPVMERELRTVNALSSVYT